MVIYGLALLSFCMFIGVYIGDLLGLLINVKANVGGVGFAMLLLILASSHGIKHGWLTPKAQEGIAFFSAMYIPIVVAMTAQQNVVAALKGGPLAIACGSVAVVVAFIFVPILTKMGMKNQT